jgi:hypothetical protein
VSSTSIDTSRATSGQRLSQPLFHSGDDGSYRSLDIARRIVGAHTDHARRQTVQRASGHDAGLRSAGRRRVHDHVGTDALLQHLADARVRIRSHPRMSTRRAESRPVSRRPREPFGDTPHGRQALGSIRHVLDLGAQQRVEQRVAGEPLLAWRHSQ